MIVYILISLVFLAAFIALNWYDKMDLTLGDLIMYTIMSFTPGVNFIMLCYISFTMIFDFDLTTFSFTILEGRE